MNGYLIAEEGPYKGRIIEISSERSLVLGRDPDESDVTLDDPEVSRKHALFFFDADQFHVENYSQVNPVLVNGQVCSSMLPLEDGDTIQIGDQTFRLSLSPPTEEGALPPSRDAEEQGEPIIPSKNSEFEPILAEVDESPNPSLLQTPWLLKVITGPNAGAEFDLEKGNTYLIGKDPAQCQILFQDLSVSRQHAKVSVDQGEHLIIEDMGSRNGVLVNGELINGSKEIESQDLITLGTTSFVLVHKERSRETIFAPKTAKEIAAEEKALQVAEEALAIEQEKLEAEEPVRSLKNWKEMIIPRQHLLFATVFAGLVLGGVMTLLALFSSAPIESELHKSDRQIRKIVSHYPSIEFSWNDNAGKLFLVGHLLTNVEKQEMLYQLRALPYIQTFEDHIVVDEGVTQNMNAILLTNNNWQGVSLQAIAPGKFALRGYLQTAVQGQTLLDFLNINFPYIDKLENQLVVDEILNSQIQSVLTGAGLLNLQYQLTGGDVVITGRIDVAHEKVWAAAMNELKNVKGIRSLKNFVVVSPGDVSRVDLTGQYQVMGFTKRNNENIFVVINGKILGKGSTIDGMSITSIETNAVFLEKDGLKFRINYNLQ